MNIERIDSAPAYMAGHSSAYEYSLTWRERQDAADATAAADFLAACQKADANALATWAPAVNDYTGLHTVGAPRPQRRPALHEVLVEALDSTNGPSMSELMQLLLNVAHGANIAAAPMQARQLLARMATSWARYNAPEVE